MTIYRRTTPRALPLQNLNLPPICDQCDRPRSTGNHRRCSERRQAANRHKWEAL